MLLSVLPYVAVITVYVDTYRTLFAQRSAPRPDAWRWLLVRPVLIGTLTPLALAGKMGLASGTRIWLLSAVGFGIVATLLSLTWLRDNAYPRLFLPVRCGRWTTKFPSHRLLLVCGIALIGYAGCLNVWAAGQT